MPYRMALDVQQDMQWDAIANGEFGFGLHALNPMISSRRSTESLEGTPQQPFLSIAEPREPRRA